MQLVLAIAVVTAVALVGARVASLNRRLPLGLVHVFVTGTEYLFLGALLGPIGLAVLDTATLRALEPVLLFGLAWIGFLFGLQFELRQLRQLPSHYFSITGLQAVITFGVVSLGSVLALATLLDLRGTALLAAAIALGATACCSAQSALAVVRQRLALRSHNLLTLLRYMTSVDGLWGILFAALAMSLLPLLAPGQSWHAPLAWIVASAAAGLVPCLALLLLLATRILHQELLLALIGAVMLCAGMASTFGVAPLLSAALCGALFANLSHHRMRALSVALQTEKPFYIAMLLLVGAHWKGYQDGSLGLAVAYFALRLLGKLVGVFCATRLYPPLFGAPATLGLGLTSEGGLAIALVFSLNLIAPGAISDALMTAVILAVLASDLLAPRLLKPLLQGRGRAS